MLGPRPGRDVIVHTVLDPSRLGSWPLVSRQSPPPRTKVCMAPWREPEGVPVPVTGVATRGGLRAVLPERVYNPCIRNLPGRSCQHRAALPGLRVSQCRLCSPGPSPNTLKECRRAGPRRCFQCSTEACDFDKVDSTSEPSGAKAVPRVQGPAPGFPVSPGFTPSLHAQPEGYPSPGPEPGPGTRTSPPRASHAVLLLGSGLCVIRVVHGVLRSHYLKLV